MNIQTLREKILSGIKEFKDIEIEEGIIEDLNLKGVIFESCYFSLDFRSINFQNSSFISCNLKCSTFIDCRFMNFEFRGNLLCSVRFINSIYINIVFEENYYHSYLLTIDDLQKLI